MKVVESLGKRSKITDWIRKDANNINVIVRTRKKLRKVMFKIFESGSMKNIGVSGNKYFIYLWWCSLWS